MLLTIFFGPNAATGDATALAWVRPTGSSGRVASGPFQSEPGTVLACRSAIRAKVRCSPAATRSAKRSRIATSRSYVSRCRAASSVTHSTEATSSFGRNFPARSYSFEETRADQ